MTTMMTTIKGEIYISAAMTSDKHNTSPLPLPAAATTTASTSFNKIRRNQPDFKRKAENNH